MACLLLIYFIFINKGLNLFFMLCLMVFFSGKETCQLLLILLISISVTFFLQSNFIFSLVCLLMVIDYKNKRNKITMFRNHLDSIIK